jgi:hypothetical protein
MSIAAITAYQINPFKPNLNLQPRYQLETCLERIWIGKTGHRATAFVSVTISSIQYVHGLF